MTNARTRSVISFIMLLFFVNSLWAEFYCHQAPLLWDNSAFKFTEQRITVAPGETVEVCVNKQCEETVGSNSVVVELAAEEDSQLMGFKMESLWFFPGVSQRCFNILLGTDDREVVYKLQIKGTEQNLNIHVPPSRGISCTHFQPREQPPLEQFNPKLMYDRFGNYYQAHELVIEQDDDCYVCEESYFQLTFAPDFLNEELRDVVCDVFRYVANEVARRPSTGDCEIEPIRIYVETFDVQNAAASTPFFTGVQTFNSVDPLINEASIIHNRIFTKMNGGEIFGTNYLIEGPDLLADGKMKLNLDADYFYDWESEDLPNPGQVDAFSIVLHEAMHLLGVSMGLGYQNIYSVWDRFLNADETPLAAGVHTTNWWQTNEDVFSALHYGICEETDANGNVISVFRCAEVDWLNDADANAVEFTIPSGASYPVPNDVFDGFSPIGAVINSFSHLGEGINQLEDAENYLMAPFRPPGTAFRSFQQAEFDVLCALGYTTGSCVGCFNIANNNGQFDFAANPVFFCYYEGFSACVEEQIVIPVEALLANDVASNPDDLEVTFLGTENTDYTVEGPIDGEYLISSNRVGSGSVTYVVNSCADHWLPHTGHVNFFFEYCPPCDNNPCDNLLCVDDLNLEGDAYFEAAVPFPYHHVFASTVFGFGNGLGIRNIDGNNVLRFGHTEHSLALELTEPIPPGCIVNLSFAGELPNMTVGLGLEIWGSNLPPCPPEESAIIPDCNIPTPCDSYVFTPICLGEVSLDNSAGFQQYEFSFENGGTEAISFLIISPTSTGSSIIQMHLDDFMAIRTCSAQIVAEVNCLDVAFSPDAIPADWLVQWTFGDGGTSSVLSPAYTYDSPGTYEVSLTIIDPLCPGNTEVSTSTISVDLGPECIPVFTCPCESPDGQQIGNGSDILLSELIDQGILSPTEHVLAANECLTLSGNLIIDMEYAISGGEVFMEPGSQISIANNLGLTLRNINNGEGIHGCTAMWEGIKLGVRSSLTIDNCIVQDAHLAIDISTVVNVVDIKNTVFENNYIGLYSSPDPAYISDFRYFYGNTFRFTNASEYLPAYEGQVNQPGPRSFAGIAMSNVDNHLRLGLSSLFGYPANRFNKLRNGILTEGLSLHITNTNFNNIRRLAQDPTAGFAVKHVGGSGHDLSIVGAPSSLNTSSVNFVNCTVAVDVTGVNTWVLSCGFTAVGSGVQVRQAHLRTIYISSNNIQAEARGIVLSNNAPALGMQVFNNVLTVGQEPSSLGIPLPGVGIAVYDVGLPAFESSVNALFGNTINTVNGDIGLSLQSVVNCSVYDNAVYLKGNGAIGIRANGMEGGDLTNNYIEGGTHLETSGEFQVIVSPQEADHHGIDLSLSPEVVLECNTLHDLGTGIYVFGENMGMDIKGSLFQPPFTKGLHYAEQLSIGKQLHHGNIWEEGTYGFNGEGAAVVNDISGIGGIQILEDQKYEIHDLASSYLPSSFAFPMLDPSEVLLAENTWFQETSGTPESCDVYTTPGISEEDKEQARKAINDELIRGGHITSRAWISKWQVYQAFKDATFSDELISSFLATATNEDYGTLSARTKEVAEAHLGDAAIYTDLLEQNLLLQSLITELTELEERGAQGQNVLVASAAKQGEIIDAIASIRTLDNNRIATRNQWVNSTTSPFLSGTSTATAIALADVQEYYLSTVALGNQNVNQAQEASLLTLANACPLVEGPAVYQARSLYQLLVDPLVVFSTNCDSPAVQARPSTNTLPAPLEMDRVTEPVTANLKAWPNPADGQLRLLVYGSYHHLSVRDNFGRVMYNSTGSERRLEIDVWDWPNGLYVITVFDENSKLLTTRKVVITH